METTVLSVVPGRGGAALYRVAGEVTWFLLMVWVITVVGVGGQNIPTGTTVEGGEQQDTTGMDNPIPGAVLGPGYSLLCATLPPPTGNAPGGAISEHDFSLALGEERNCSVGLSFMENLKCWCFSQCKKLIGFCPQKSFLW